MEREIMDGILLRKQSILLKKDTTAKMHIRELKIPVVVLCQLNPVKTKKGDLEKPSV